MNKRITSPAELARLKETFKGETALRGEPKEIQITVHMGTCGIAAGAREILNTLTDLLLQQDIDNVTLRRSGCIGLCDQEPMFTLADSSGKEFLYGKLNASRVQQIIREHVLEDKPLTQLLVNV